MYINRIEKKYRGCRILENGELEVVHVTVDPSESDIHDALLDACNYLSDKAFRYERVNPLYSCSRPGQLF